VASGSRHGGGGVAVALAAQNILGDLFASLSIIIDKPFVLGDFLGDFLIVGDQLGSVEQIGMKTTREQVELIPEILKEAVGAQGEDRVRFDRSHFQSYGDFALVFETVYYVLSPDYNVYMDCQQAINLKILQRFE
jgi:hypothetical protein